MECRKCGACCIALSISTLNKPAGARCPHLTAENLCSLWKKPERPRVCSAFMPDPAFCGSSFEEALKLMGELERESQMRDGKMDASQGSAPG
ncbi:YkgJ family cysteine cluster protein [Candidatus Solincola sp.]|nr:YkgJ family cysteine cluster protein [Actinomycetota bacterium]MDI7252705.1 YkgJ family cysteine cluster protein [Actinomycetota bacterium]